MNKMAKGETFAENNVTYETIADGVSTEMEFIGHTRKFIESLIRIKLKFSYARQYLITRARGTDYDSKDFAYACLLQKCALASSMSAYSLMFRTRTDTNDVVERYEDLEEFSNSSYPKFFNAMDT